MEGKYSIMIIIGIDLDDCVFETSTKIAEVISKKIDKEIDLSDMSTYYFEHKYNLEEKFMAEVVSGALSSYLEEVPNCVQVINWLGHFYPLHFISLRRDELMQHTLSNLYKIGINPIFSNLHFVRKEKGVPAKAKIINELEITDMVEDRPDTILDLYNRTEANILVFDKPWNKSIEENSRIKRVKDWFEIRSYFMTSVVGEYK